MTYIIRTFRGAFRMTDELRVRHPEIRRVKRDLGWAQQVEGTGRHDRTKVDIATGRYTDQFGRSERHGGYDVVQAPATAAGVKTVVRHLRDQEAVLIAGHAADIQRLEAELSAAREAHRTALRNAWVKGNVVRINEVLALVGWAIP